MFANIAIVITFSYNVKDKLCGETIDIVDVGKNVNSYCNSGYRPVLLEHSYFWQDVSIDINMIVEDKNSITDNELAMLIMSYGNFPLVDRMLLDGILSDHKMIHIG